MTVITSDTDFTPLYLRVKQAILDRIRSGEMNVGDQIESLQQLERRYAVSVGTCKRALTELIHEGVLIGRQGKGVYVRSTFGKEDVRQIALVAWCEEKLSQHPAFAAVLHGLMEPIAQSSFQLSVCFLDPRHLSGDEMQARLAKIHADGIVITHTPQVVQKDLIPLTHKGVPLVAIGRPMAKLTPYAVLSDTDEALHGVLRAAWAKGKKRFALIGSPVDDIFAKRLAVFEKFAAESGWSRENLTVLRGSADYATGRELMKQLLLLPVLPEVLIADDDYVGYGALDALEKHGLHAPGDIQLVGMGGFLKDALSSARLSSIALPYAASGSMAAEMVLRLVAHQTVAKPMPVLPCPIVGNGTWDLSITTVQEPVLKQSLSHAPMSS